MLAFVPGNDDPRRKLRQFLLRSSDNDDRVDDLRKIRTTRGKRNSPPNGSQALGRPIRLLLPPHRTMPPIRLIRSSSCKYNLHSSNERGRHEQGKHIAGHRRRRRSARHVLSALPSPEEGYTVHVGGPEKRLYHLVQHERPPGWDITRETPGYHLAADVAFKEVSVMEYAGMVISGGRAPEYLRYDEDLLNLTRLFFEWKKPVASVCHGIEIVAAAGVIRATPRRRLRSASWTSNPSAARTSIAKWS